MTFVISIITTGITSSAFYFLKCNLEIMNSFVNNYFEKIILYLTLFDTMKNYKFIKIKVSSFLFIFARK